MRKPPDSLDAWAAYQRGLWHLTHFSAEDAKRAQDFFHRSIKLDPNFVSAYSGLALTHLDFGSIWGLQDMTEAQAAAERLTRRGLALDSSDPQVRSMLSVTLYMRGDYSGAVTEAHGALGISPNLAEGSRCARPGADFCGKICGRD